MVENVEAQLRDARRAPPTIRRDIHMCAERVAFSVLVLALGLLQ